MTGIKRAELATEFTTFDEMVAVLALNTPHALVLDWWRRLERAIDYYFEARGLQRPGSVKAEEALADDAEVGSEVAEQIRQLRLVRNAVAHEETKAIGRDEAAKYAATCLNLIWRVAIDPKRNVGNRDGGHLSGRGHR
jgi:hypothetical protein